MQVNEALHHLIARTQMLERLPWILSVVLAVALCFRMAELTWRIVPLPGTEEIIPPEPSVAVAAQSAKPVVAASISQLNLFGRVEIAAPQVEEQIVVPETRLNLTLLGVISSSTARTAKAIISDASGNEEYYSIGMQVPGGASLEEIHADYVMLKRNNRLEMLRLPADESVVGQPGGGGTAGIQPNMPAAVPQGRRMLPPSTMNADNRSTGAMLHEYRDALNQDPQSVMDLVRAEPVREGDKLVGYRISPGRDRQLLSRFGLRSGDVVTMVNGVRLDNPVKGLEIIQNLQTAAQVNIEVMRNGVTQGFSFAVE